MPDFDKTFRNEYTYAAAFLKDEAAFSARWQWLVRRLKLLMAPVGFSPEHATALDDLRREIRGHLGTEDQALLSMLVIDEAPAGAQVPNPKALVRLAVLKLLRHVYLLSAPGAHAVWLVSLPTRFGNWPTDEFTDCVSSMPMLCSYLRDRTEIFSQRDKQDLAFTAQQALAWCQKTDMVLAEARSGNNETAITLVRRWFADPQTDEKELKQTISILSTGFKKILALLNKGRLILTDWVPLRNATGRIDQNWLNAEAFTFPEPGEGLDVVYIEQAFFSGFAASVLHGPKNWVRILVHELSHMASGTTDVNLGFVRYAHRGIGPHAGFPGRAAAQNADNWAFFCADCAGELTHGERNHALKII